jgi:hypothetical protein
LEFDVKPGMKKGSKIKFKGVGATKKKAAGRIYLSLFQRSVETALRYDSGLALCHILLT